MLVIKNGTLISMAGIYKEIRCCCGKRENCES